MIRNFMSPSIVIEILLTPLFLEKTAASVESAHRAASACHLGRLRQSLVEQLILIQKMKNL